MDWIRQDAIYRNLEVIGEAIAALDGTLESKYPNVLLLEAKNMRNFLFHEYFRIYDEAVWGTITKDVPDLKPRIISVLEDLENKSSS